MSLSPEQLPAGFATMQHVARIHIGKASANVVSATAPRKLGFTFLGEEGHV